MKYLFEKILVRSRILTIPFAKNKYLRKITSATMRIFSKSNKEILINNYDGNLFFHCELGEHISGSIFWKGYYSEAELMTLASILKDDSVFVDIGANKGVFTVFAAKRLPNGRVLSFEPTSKNYNVLKRNVDVNKFDNVELFEIGISDKHKVIPIYGPNERYLDGTKNEGAFSIFASEKTGQFLQDIEVDSLDSILRNNPSQKIDVIKIDVEGSEVDVLNGMIQTILKYKPYILIESNDKALRSAGHTSGEIFSILDKFSYKYKPANDIKHTNLDADELFAYRDIICIPTK